MHPDGLASGSIDWTFEQVYDIFRPKIHRYLCRLVGEAEAEDLTQEVFLKVNQALPCYRGDARISTWLYRIAGNAALDRIRSSSFRQVNREMETEELEEFPQNFSICQDGDFPALPAVEEDLFRNDRFRCFMEFVDRLPVKYRQVIILGEVEQLTCRQMAGILGISQSSVKMRLHRARESLFQMLRSNCDPGVWL